MGYKRHTDSRTGYNILVHISASRTFKSSSACVYLFFCVYAVRLISFACQKDNLECNYSIIFLYYGNGSFGFVQSLIGFINTIENVMIGFIDDGKSGVVG